MSLLRGPLMTLTYCFVLRNGTSLDYGTVTVVVRLYFHSHITVLFNKTSRVRNSEVVSQVLMNAQCERIVVVCKMMLWVCSNRHQFQYVVQHQHRKLLLLNQRVDELAVMTKSSTLVLGPHFERESASV